MSNAQEMEKRRVRRLQRSEEEKRRLVEETRVAGASITAIAKARGVNSSQLFKWRRQYQCGLLPAESDESVLLPVRISDEAAERRVKSKSESKSTSKEHRYRQRFTLSLPERRCESKVPSI